jgi:hypothetical protein
LIKHKDNIILLILIWLHLRVSYKFSRPFSEQKPLARYHHITREGSTPEISGQFKWIMGYMGRLNLNTALTSGPLGDY